MKNDTPNARLRAQIERLKTTLAKLQKPIAKAKLPQDEPKTHRLVATINVR